MFTQLHAQLDNFPKSISIEGIIQIVVIEDWLNVGLGGSKFQLSGSGYQLDTAGNANAQGLHAVATLIDPPGCKGLHTDFHIVVQGGTVGGIPKSHLHSGDQAIQRKARFDLQVTHTAGSSLRFWPTPGKSTITRIPKQCSTEYR